MSMFDVAEGLTTHVIDVGGIDQVPAMLLVRFLQIPNPEDLRQPNSMNNMMESFHAHEHLFLSAKSMHTPRMEKTHFRSEVQLH